MLARTTRSRFARLALAVLGSAALLVTTPGLASADRKDRHDHRHHYKHRDKHHRGHYEHPRQYGYRSAPRVYFHGDSCDDRGHGGYYRHRAPRYHCGPCSHYFSSYDALHVHVHHAHHVPLFRLHHVIVQTSVGFGFPGW